MNALRSLAVDIMFNTGASKLLEVNSAVDGVKSNALEAAGNMDALGDSVESTGKKSDKFLGISKGFAAITAAGVALGGALQKVTSRADELDAGLRRVEVQTGIAVDEMRKMVQTLSDPSWDVSQTIASMEDLVSMGITTKEEFETILPVLAEFKTATGRSMTDGLKTLDAVFSTLNIELTEAGEHIDTLTWLSESTTVGMMELGQVMRREQARIREMGLTFDEIAVALAALEAEGKKGPRMVMGFQDAIKAAEGDIQEFWRNLGVSA